MAGWDPPRTRGREGGRERERGALFDSAHPPVHCSLFRRWDWRSWCGPNHKGDKGVGLGDCEPKRDQSLSLSQSQSQIWNEHNINTMCGVCTTPFDTFCLAQVGTFAEFSAPADFAFMMQPEKEVRCDAVSCRVVRCGVVSCRVVCVIPYP